MQWLFTRYKTLKPFYGVFWVSKALTDFLKRADICILFPFIFEFPVNQKSSLGELFPPACHKTFLLKLFWTFLCNYRQSLQHKRGFSIFYKWDFLLFMALCVIGSIAWGPFTRSIVFYITTFWACQKAFLQKL